MTIALISAPLSLTLFTCREAYKEFLEQRGLEPSKIDGTTAGCVYNSIVDGQVLVYVDASQNLDELSASLVHESVHVFSRIRDYMNLGYDEETSAYAIESIFTQLKRLYQSRIGTISGRT